MEEIWLTMMQTGASMLRVSVILVFAAMGGMFSERSGVINIALEGKMLGAAFAAAAVASLTGSAYLGVFAGILVSISLAMLHGYASISKGGDQVISGLAINMLMMGMTVVLGLAIFGEGGRTPMLSGDERFLPITLPYAEAARDIPYFGPFYSVLLSGHNIFVYAMFVAVPVLWWLLERTHFGLNIRSVGDNPKAVDVAGINVFRVRYQAQIMCGLLVGISGCYLSLAQNAFFIRNMTAGQGYIALAALIFGKWRPFSTLVGCLIFALLDALSIRIQGVELPIVGRVPLQLIQAIPYIMTVVLLAGIIGRARAPFVIGQPYRKEHV